MLVSQERGISKVVVLGEPLVGKTSIIQAIVTRKEPGYTFPTNGANFTTTSLQVDNETVSLNIWDTAGQEIYRSLTPLYARGSNAAIMVISAVSEQSLDSIDSWYKVITQYCEPSVKVYLALNQMDREMVISSDEAKRWCKEHDVQYFETTIKKLDTIERLFEKIAKDLKPTTSQGTGPQVFVNSPGSRSEKHTECC